MQREKTKSERAHGQAGRQRSVDDRPQFAQKILGFFPKFLYKITQFTPTPHFGNLERKF
jgi:hypothetical protein